MKLHLFRNSDNITLKWYTVKHNGCKAYTRLATVTEKGEGALGYCNKFDNCIGLNIDKVSKHPFNFIRIPQIIAHELIHYFFPSEYVTVKIHKLVDYFKGFVL